MRKIELFLMAHENGNFRPRPTNSKILEINIQMYPLRKPTACLMNMGNDIKDIPLKKMFQKDSKILKSTVKTI